MWNTSLCLPITKHAQAYPHCGYIGYVVWSQVEKHRKALTQLRLGGKLYYVVFIHIELKSYVVKALKYYQVF